MPPDLLVPLADAVHLVGGHRLPRVDRRRLRRVARAEDALDRRDMLFRNVERAVLVLLDAKARDGQVVEMRRVEFRHGLAQAFAMFVMTPKAPGK